MVQFTHLKDIKLTEYKNEHIELWHRKLGNTNFLHKDRYIGPIVGLLPSLEGKNCKNTNYWDKKLEKFKLALLLKPYIKYGALDHSANPDYLRPNNSENINVNINFVKSRKNKKSNSGSFCIFITEELVKTLNLKKKSFNIHYDYDKNFLYSYLYYRFYYKIDKNINKDPQYGMLHKMCFIKKLEQINIISMTKDINIFQ
ncbi:hypothetical protein H8356DRAFT_1334935 [Neocallimastix lanati (nom. inval.)]|nr:hypothetical protein H8356DRAFT_1334935 [Neocallimastix sp. JGI-2020a]